MSSNPADELRKEMVRREMRCLLILLLLATPALPQLSDAQKSAIDNLARKTLAETGVPAASIAVVKDGKIAMASAYGDAKLNPKVAATPAMLFKIASNSKQFAATAVLLLAEQHKLSLDDPVSRYLPTLTRAGEVTLRQLLSHTSGYEDYYPLDYVTPWMARDTTAESILDQWAKKPLNFDPGTRWQYSNTGYVIIGQIVEKVTHKPFIEFLRTNILEPLGMHSAIDESNGKWSDADPVGYHNFGFGPARPAIPEGGGWTYACGELAMSASDLARWDMSLMNGTILKPASLKELTTEVVLKNGTGTGYGLGLFLSADSNGHRRWAHSGGAAGFFSYNVTLPDDHMAVTVLTNGQGKASSLLDQRIVDLLLTPAVDAGGKVALERARKIFSGLQKGQLDRSFLTDDAVSYFTEQGIADLRASLGPLGEPTSFTEVNHIGRGGLMVRSFVVQAGGKRMWLETYIQPDGKFAQYMVDPAPATP
jgi:D-alanyl-D-alanine carboxypeptidase